MGEGNDERNRYLPAERSILLLFSGDWKPKMVGIKERASKQ